MFISLQILMYATASKLLIFLLQAAESGIIKVKTIAARNTDILAGNYLQCSGKNKLVL